MVVSLNPDTFVKGGLFSDVDVLVRDFYFTLESPEGYTVADRIFAKADLTILSDNTEVENFWSAGQSADFVPSKDGPVEGSGYGLVETGSKSRLNDNTNISIFLNELVLRCGFPKERLDAGRLDVLKGAVLHVVRIPTKREGLESQKKEGAREQTVLVPNKIVKMPAGVAAAKRGKAGATPSAAAATAAVAPAEDAGDVKKIVEEILAGTGGTMKALKTGLLRKFLKSPNRAEILAQGTSDELLLELGYVVEGEEIDKVA